MLATGKLILGTAQFGLQYGVNNSIGLPSDQTINSILNLAFSQGIGILDTAEAYGDAHHKIGNYHKHSQSKFKVITKFSALRDDLPLNLIGRIENNLNDLGVSSLYTYMFHSYRDYQIYFPKLKDEMLAAQREGLIQKIGVSVYDNAELAALIDNDKIQVIQLPYNLLDNASRRMKLIMQAKERGKEIHVRSIFLQGLFFKNLKKFTSKLMPLNGGIKELREIALKHDISLNSLALNYSISHPLIDYALFGLDTVEQLEDNINSLDASLSSEVKTEIEKIEIKNSYLLNPIFWNLSFVLVTQARTGSRRFPHKVLKKINGKTLLELHISRICSSKLVDEIIVATSEKEDDREIESLCSKLNIACYRGSEDNVLDRFYQCLKDKKPDYVVRLTSDCPLIDADLIDQVINFTVLNKLDYCSNTLHETFPDGQDVEVFKFSALEEAWKNAKKNYELEHVTPYIRERSTFYGNKEFTSADYSSPQNYGGVRLTVDNEEDFEVISSLVKELGTDKSWKEYADFYLSDLNMNKLNSHYKRNEGFIKD